MTPKHIKANHFRESGLFDNLKRFSTLEKRLSELPTEKQRGDAFEVFAEAYLATQTIMQAQEVWTFDSIPPALKRRFRLDISKDMGVDGLIATQAGEHHAYQVKFRTDRPSLTWTELSTFIGLSDKTDQKLIFTNCNRIASVVEKRDDVFFVRGNDLDRLEASDFELILNWLKKSKKPKPKKEPRDFQEEAINDILQSLDDSRRTTSVMACGTGKTLIALWVAERSGYKNVLVLLPSLALVSQTIHEWMRETSWEELSYLCVCSDPTVTKEADNWVVRQSDVDFPVSTDSQVVRKFLSKRTAGVKIIFSTYQSAQVVAEGLNTKSGFDFGIFDEAHKTAGREGTKFGFALDDSNLPIRRRLFLTATPRHYNVLKKDKEGESTLIYSMDDPEVYGKRAYTLPFFEAAKRKIICGYKVLISVVTSDEVNEEFLRRGEVLVEGDEVKARQVANQLSLKRATEKYPVNKAFTFHTFVNSAKSFTSEGGEGLHSHLPEFETFHVNGSMPAARREELLKAFEGSKRAVMSNARCLTEGVNIPVVDMVAFMSPKKSRVDIVQATGRAMRKAGRKKKGYILIPLFLQQAKGESIEDALERTDFKEVWYVLQAMQEQDKELAEIIQQAVVEKGSKKTKGYDDQRFIEKVEVIGLDIGLDRLQKAITTRCIEKLGVSWDLRYGELVAYKEKYGDCNVSQIDPDNYQLGGWVSHQRNNYRENNLRQERVRKLEELGFLWNTVEAKWEEMYGELLRYRRKHEDCNVPSRYSENPQLGLWVSGQRKSYRKGELSQDRIKKLEILDFHWDSIETQWKEMYEELVNYKEKIGDCNVPHGYPKNPPLGLWVLSQRASYKKGRLAQDKIKKLEALGFVWNTPEAQWKIMYQELIKYKKEYGDCNVPVNHSETLRLGRWIRGQRTAYRKGRLAKDRVELLEALGLLWSIHEAQWEEMYRELIDYKKLNGNCNVPQGYSKNPSLAKWISQQRVLNNKGGLSQDKFEKLEEIGFVWKAYEAKWESKYLELVVYKKEHGDCNVPYDCVENPSLGLWVLNQRIAHKKGELKRDIVTKLEALGFIWDIRESHWEEMYQKLIAYKNKHGDCNVPRGNVESELGKWVSRQRSDYKRGKIKRDRKIRLETLGFIWDTKQAEWEEMYQELINYNSKHGHCRVPQDYKINPKLATWVRHQRAFYKKGELTVDRAKKLEIIGLVLDPHATQWEEMYQELVEYKEEYENCDVPAKYLNNPRLGTWVRNQKHRRDELSPDRIKKLEKLGFEWEPRNQK